MIELKAKLFDDLERGGKDAVLAALQQAIELEHATIPAYLYALYSLDSTKNAGIAGIIRSIVVEEMLHMTLACNLLNALDCHPLIDTPDFIPDYPGPLPGSVESGLTVRLAPFSLDVVHDIFMKIEEPEQPLKFPVRAALAEVKQPLTIGQFYRSIEQQILKLGDGAFTGLRRYQVESMPHAVVVWNVATAREAIETIVQQGEGTSKSPLEMVGSGYAHYYRFAEIYHGKRLIKNPEAGPDTPPDRQYLYGGTAIAFDQTGVCAVQKDPKASKYAPGSVARNACDTFNCTYTNLLRSLHATFHGDPNRLEAAIGLMMSLEQQAKGMMSGTSTAGQPVGPSFEYQPVNS